METTASPTPTPPATTPSTPPATTPSTPPAPAAPSSGGGPSGGGRVIGSDFNTFLRMLTVQMQNQDPLNPIDSSDYAVQLATFSGVEQQVRTNELLGALTTQLRVSGLAELAGWVGQEARAAMPARFEGRPIALSPNPAANADEAVLVVRDAQGREVARSPIPVSSDPIEWAGTRPDGTPLPNGTYRFEVESRRGGDLLRTDPVETYALVREVRSEGDRTVLVMAGGATVPADAVTALRDPG